MTIEEKVVQLEKEITLTNFDNACDKALDIIEALGIENKKLKEEIKLAKCHDQDQSQHLAVILEENEKLKEKLGIANEGLQKIKRECNLAEKNKCATNYEVANYQNQLTSHQALNKIEDIK